MKTTCHIKKRKSDKNRTQRKRRMVIGRSNEVAKIIFLRDEKIKTYGIKN